MERLREINFDPKLVNLFFFINYGKIKGDQF